MMRAPVPSEPNYTFPTYQVPQVSAMRGRAPPVQVARTPGTAGAGPPTVSPRVHSDAPSVIFGSSCPSGNSNLRMQSVTDNCLLNSVTVPKIQRNVAHNNSDKLASKSGALLLLGQDIPGNQKADKIPPGLTITSTTTTTTTNAKTTTTTQQTISRRAPAVTTTMLKRGGAAKTTQYLEEGSYIPLARLTELCARTNRLQRLGCPLPPMRLLGGGESSINTGTSGWGTPPSQQASNNNANTSSGWGTANPANQNNTGTQQWNNNANRPPTSGPGGNTNQDANKANSNLAPNGQQPPSSQGNPGWGQPGPKPPAAMGPPAATNNSNAAPIPSNQSGVVGGTNSALPASSNTTKQQLEQLTNMREAIFSQDGWGGQHVNQDTNWDIPGSPEPQLKMDGTSGGAPPWKPCVNNGTELWEANLRNGGQPPPQPQQKAPWGHTPSTNIGGTWGEDDDISDSSNLWTVPSSNQMLPKKQGTNGVPSGQQQQWGNSNNANSGTMWGGPKKENEWSGSTPNPGWGEQRAPDPRGAPSMDPRDIRTDPRDMRAGSTEMRLMDPRGDPMRIVNADMRGDPRGITGRLNGTGAEAFWAQAGPQTGAHHMHHQGKMPVGPGNGGAGWEEPSPPSQRRNMPNYDDGTSLWGNPQPGSHWKDLPTGGSGSGMAGRGGSGGPPGMAGPTPRVGMKPLVTSGDGGSVWRNGGGGGGGSWGDEPGPVAGGWGEDVPWPKQKAMGGGGGGAPLWGENDMDWGHKGGPKPPLAKEAVWNSKQFRMLVDMGYKKEDVENALRMRDMNYDDALDILGSLRNSNMDGWRGRHDDHYDHQQFPGQRGCFPSGPSTQMNFPPGGNTPNLLNNMGGSAGGSNSLINNMSPAIMQKMLAQVGGGSQGFGSAGGGGSGGRQIPQQTQPSTQQLRMLVQQIQMAVQAGYLNHQILNQPLAPQTLVLLNQLLQQIKNLQQLLNQQQVAQSQCIGNKPSNALLQCSVYITKTKQQIQNLQNQIAAQQAIYVKQQQHQISSNDLFKSNMQDTINSLQSNFGDLGMKEPPQISQPQSRLTQWKLPALEKDENGEFSRAPGSASKPLVPSHSSPNLNPLGPLSHSDGPWSTGRSNSGDTGWPDSAPVDTSSSDLKESQWAPPTQTSLTDLVPEFEPGKPWKGNQKSIEDDPNITPGSVARSPLSLSTISTIKDSELFMNPSKSPPAGNESIQPLSLSSSTWSFNPPSSTSSTFTSPQNNKLPTSKGVLGGLNPAASSELWGAPKRGPPPGLTAKGGNSAVNGWASNSPASSAWGAQRNNWSTSQWLLLRNLTPQIDGATLRTLCLQHGPLPSFHLYLNQGFALAKYSSQEEAVKAQTALNNCVLSNTTILAENPTDWEATLLLQQVASQPGGSSSSGWRGAGSGGGGGGAGSGQKPNSVDTWSTGWPGGSSASLWGSTALDSSDQSRATPSSLQPYLPGDLLGGESM